MLYEHIESYDPMLASERPQAPAMPRPQAIPGHLGGLGVLGVWP